MTCSTCVGAKLGDCPLWCVFSTASYSRKYSLRGEGSVRMGLLPGLNVAYGANHVWAVDERFCRTILDTDSYGLRILR
jgi:hypothetical protein